MSNGPRSISPYFHHASAFGIAGKIDRPIQHTIATQAAISLASSGGHGTHRVDNYSVPGVVSFKAAYVEVGGSLDTAREEAPTHTTYALSVIEDLNICNVVTADRVVSRLTVYYPASVPPPLPAAQPEPSFSIAGSHFDNLKVAGKNPDVSLDIQSFHDSTYSTFFNGLNGPTPEKKHVLIASNIDLKKLTKSDHNYNIVSGIAERYRQWKPSEQSLANGQHFWCSAANRREWVQPCGDEANKGSKAKKSKANKANPSNRQPEELRTESADPLNFGGLICVPRFGVVYLAEVLVYRNHRHLNMIRVQMCSPGDGSLIGPGTGGGGDGIPPRP